MHERAPIKRQRRGQIERRTGFSPVYIPGPRRSARAQSGEAGVPGLDITAFYKDGTQATSNETPFSKTGNPLTPNNLFPGQGMTVYYAIVNVPKPTKANPLVKLVLRYTANNDPGYPPVYRMLHPVVTP